jgi:hypothetical protein
MKIEKHGKTLGEIGLPERPEGCAVGARYRPPQLSVAFKGAILPRTHALAGGSAMAKAQGVDTPTDEAGVRKTPAGILAADPVCLSSLLKTGFTVLVD